MRSVNKGEEVQGPHIEPVMSTGEIKSGMSLNPNCGCLWFTSNAIPTFSLLYCFIVNSQS